MKFLNSFFAKTTQLKVVEPFPLGKPDPEWMKRLELDDLDIFNGGGFPRGEPSPLDFSDFG